MFLSSIFAFFFSISVELNLKQNCVDTFAKCLGDVQVTIHTPHPPQYALEKTKESHLMLLCCYCCYRHRQSRPALLSSLVVSQSVICRHATIKIRKGSQTFYKWNTSLQIDLNKRKIISNLFRCTIELNNLSFIGGYRRILL